MYQTRERTTEETAIVCTLDFATVSSISLYNQSKQCDAIQHPCSNSWHFRCSGQFTRACDRNTLVESLKRFVLQRCSGQIVPVINCRHKDTKYTSQKKLFLMFRNDWKRTQTVVCLLSWLFLACSQAFSRPLSFQCVHSVKASGIWHHLISVL